MGKYRKKPVVIEAIQFQPAGFAQVESFCGDKASLIGNWTAADPFPKCVHIATLEGTMTALPGDWIIKGVKGEFYPCKPDIFEATYEPAEPTNG
jgi:hypothetical protein